MNTTALINALQTLLDDARDERNRLADRMVENQKLPTSEERHADGFSLIYGDLRQSEYRVGKLLEAIAALRAIQP